MVSKQFINDGDMQAVRMGSEIMFLLHMVDAQEKEIEELKLQVQQQKEKIDGYECSRAEPPDAERRGAP